MLEGKGRCSALRQNNRGIRNVMTGPKGQLPRAIAVDFLVALALVWATTFALWFAQDRAHADYGTHVRHVGEAAASARGIILNDHAALAARSRSTTLSQAAAQRHMPLFVTHVLLSVVIAGLIAFNLAFWRHLRWAYAAPRHGLRPRPQGRGTRSSHPPPHFNHLRVYEVGQVSSPEDP